MRNSPFSFLWRYLLKNFAGKNLHEKFVSLKRSAKRGLRDEKDGKFFW
jgi:hypothetical protein